MASASAMVAQGTLLRIFTAGDDVEDEGEDLERMLPLACGEITPGEAATHCRDLPGEARLHRFGVSLRIYI
jgi:hypothetical protein